MLFGSAFLDLVVIRLRSSRIRLAPGSRSCSVRLRSHKLTSTWQRLISVASGFMRQFAAGSLAVFQWFVFSLALGRGRAKRCPGFGQVHAVFEIYSWQSGERRLPSSCVRLMFVLSSCCVRFRSHKLTYLAASHFSCIKCHVSVRNWSSVHFCMARLFGGARTGTRK